MVADTFIETPAPPSKHRSQAVAAIILGIAATLAALAAYNGNLADGDALQGYTSSTTSLNDANAFWAQGNTVAAADQSLFVEYANASFAGEGNRAQYLRTLMRPELDEAVTWWESTEEAETPFDELEGNPYTIADYDEARALEERTELEFDEASPPTSGVTCSIWRPSSSH